MCSVNYSCSLIRTDKWISFLIPLIEAVPVSAWFHWKRRQQGQFTESRPSKKKNSSAVYILCVGHFLCIIRLRKQAVIGWKKNNYNLNWPSENDAPEERLRHFYWIIHNITNIEISSFIFITQRIIKFKCKIWPWRFQHNRRSIRKKIMMIFNTKAFNAFHTLQQCRFIIHLADFSHFSFGFDSSSLIFSSLSSRFNFLR